MVVITNGQHSRVKHTLLGADENCSVQ